MNHDILENCKILIKKFQKDVKNGKIKLSEEERKEYEKIIRKIDLNKK